MTSVCGRSDRKIRLLNEVEVVMEMHSNRTIPEVATLIHPQITTTPRTTTPSTIPCPCSISSDFHQLVETLISTFNPLPHKPLVPPTLTMWSMDHHPHRMWTTTSMDPLYPLRHRRRPKRRRNSAMPTQNLTVTMETVLPIRIRFATERTIAVIEWMRWTATTWTTRSGCEATMTRLIRMTNMEIASAALVRKWRGTKGSSRCRWKDSGDVFVTETLISTMQMWRVVNWASVWAAISWIAYRGLRLPSYTQMECRI